jgi:hypothetical protein
MSGFYNIYLILHITLQINIIFGVHVSQDSLLIMDDCKCDRSPGGYNLSQPLQAFNSSPFTTSIEEWGILLLFWPSHLVQPTRTRVKRESFWILELAFPLKL